MGIDMCIEIFKGNIWVKYVLFLANKVVIYAIFWGKALKKIFVRLRFLPNSMSV